VLRDDAGPSFFTATVYTQNAACNSTTMPIVSYGLGIEVTFIVPKVIMTCLVSGT
jgi:hypothetical protein